MKELLSGLAADRCPENATGDGEGKNSRRKSSLHGSLAKQGWNLCNVWVEPAEGAQGQAGPSGTGSRLALRRGKPGPEALRACAAARAEASLERGRKPPLGASLAQ